MDPAIVIPLGAFVALAALFAVVLLRAGRVIADTRDAEHFRRAVDDLASRIDTSLRGVIERIDAVRRRQVEPDAIGENLAAATDAVGRYLAEARGLRAPAATTAIRSAFEAEIERAERALEMVEHGCSILAGGHGFVRDVEGETAIKRGYLNLLHAREAIGEYAVEIRSAREGIEPRWFSRRRSA